MPKIKIDVISGFLGAGKTTLLSKYTAFRIKNGERVAVIENEFGEAGIDGAFLKNEGLSVYEIVDGCICCSLKGDIINTLEKLSEKEEINRVIIEPTGIFMLNEIYEIIAVPTLASHYEIGAIVTVVDGRNYLKQVKKYGYFFENQLEWAQRLILSKTGLIDEETIIETITSLQKKSGGIDIEAQVWDNFTELDWKRLFSGESMTKTEKSTKCSCGHTHHNENEHNHGGFMGISVVVNRCFSRTSLVEALKKLSTGKFGDIPRAKGIVAEENRGSLEFDYVNGEVDLRYSEDTCEKCLVSIIGISLQRNALTSLFHKIE